ncbi:MAG: carboxypeptidase regulatory-like domain-containing protein, partial [Thermoanaerobaculia bacterium]
SGRFVFSTLADGSFDVTVSAEGYVSAEKKSVSTGAGELQFSLAPEAVYSGSVLSEENGAPVAQAEVTLRGGDRGRERFSAKTDAKGLFAVRKASQGSFTVSADHPDYAPSTEETRELEAGKKVEGEVIRLPRGLSATGKVVDGLTQAAIAQAVVTFTHESQGSGSVPRRTAQTGPEGTFEVKGLREGKFALAARARGYFSSKPQAVTIAPGGGREFTIPLEAGSSIAGRVLDTAGKPIAGATVRPNPAFSNNQGYDPRFQSLQDANALSDSEGRYLLEGLPPHPNYRVVATHREYAPSSSKPLALNAREAVENADLTLSRGGVVRGRVVDEKGSPLAGAGVSASRARGQGAAEEEEVGYYFGDPRSASATSDRDGNYSLPRLEAGLYTLRAQLRGRASAQRDGVQLVEERATEAIDFTLGEGETLAGRVVDSDGSPIAGARVRAYGPDQAEARSDADGRFEVKGLQ